MPPALSPVPVGTVPIYEALERANGDVSGITWELFKQVGVNMTGRCEYDR